MKRSAVLRVAATAVVAILLLGAANQADAQVTRDRQR
jgi:hypothetical protein